MWLDEIDRFVASVVAEHGVPGAVAAVWDGDITHVSTVGVRSVEDPVPLTPETQFQVGSVTKTFTSAAIALLVEEGSVAWDDPVARHLPALAAALAPRVDLEAVTVEHLVSHRSGFDGDHILIHPESPDLTVLAGARHLFAPGEGYSYSNAAFSLAGELLATVDGVPYAEAMRNRVLDPLGFVAACFTADEAVTRPVALPHWVVGGEAVVLRRAGWQPGWELSALDRAAGGLIASPAVLTEWGRIHADGRLADGTELLSEGSRARLHAPVVEGDQVSSVGLDWEVSEHDGVTVVGHGGLTVGYSTTFCFVPEHRVSVAVCTHATNGGAVNQAIRRWLLEQTCGIVVRDPEPDPEAAESGAVARAEGRYLHPFGILTVAAGEDPGTLRITTEARTDVGWQPPPDPPLTYALTGPADAISIDDEPGNVAQLLRIGEGWIQTGGRRAPRIDD